MGHTVTATVTLYVLIALAIEALIFKAICLVVLARHFKSRHVARRQTVKWRRSELFQPLETRPGYAEYLYEAEFGAMPYGVRL